MKTVFLLFLSTLFLSCHDTIQVIEGCCEEPAKAGIFTFGSYSLANIFTPNGDGINDRWVVRGDSAFIKEIKIWNSDNVLVFHRTILPLNDQDNSWDGTFNTEIQIGVFNYELILEFFNGIVLSFNGNFCSFPCGPEYNDVEFDRQNCYLGPETSIQDPCFF